MIQLYKLFCINRGMGIENMGAYKNTTENQESLDNNLGSLNNAEEFKDINKQKKNLEQLTFAGSKELLDKEACINEAKIQIYEKCGINDNMDKNSRIENFCKGCIDELIIGNFDMAIEVINTRGQIILDALEQLLSWDGLKQVAEELGESVWDLFRGDAYDKGVSAALFIGVIPSVAKKGLKMSMKQVSQLRIAKTKIVESPEVKTVISETLTLIGGIVPKKQFDGVDVLEMRGNYALNNIPGLKVLDAGKKIEDFAESIDINHLVNNPDRIDIMLDIIEDMGYYIDENISSILHLNNSNLVDFKASFTLLRKRLGKLLHDDRLEQSYKADIKEVYENSIKNGFYTLHPNLAPKK